MTDNTTIIRDSSPLYSLKNILSDEAFEVSNKTTIGRQQDCDIVLDDNHVSRVHTLLQIKGTALHLYNKSTNGTLVNGKKVDECVLQINDIVKIDSFEFIVLLLENETIDVAKDEQTSQDELTSTLIENTDSGDESARTSIVPEVWADAREKIKLASAPASDDKEKISQESLSENNTTEMNKMLGISETPKVKPSNEKRAPSTEGFQLNTEINTDVTYLFGYHEKIFDEAYPLNKESLVIGKSTECDIVLADPSVSSKHAKFYQVNQTWLIEDLNSTNGSFVNGLQINEATTLKKGDFIQLGLLQLVFGQHEPIAYTPKTGLMKWLVVAGSAIAIVGMAAFYLAR